MMISQQYADELGKQTGELEAENAALRAALIEACDIALGSDLTRQAAERVSELRRIDARK